LVVTAEQPNKGASEEASGKKNIIYDNFTYIFLTIKW
jgi:hypothetical protein